MATAAAITNEHRPKIRTKDVTQLSAKSSGYTTSVTFEGMLLPERLLVGLHAAGFVRPSPIQYEAIPVGRCGFDMVIQAKSGTGKTVVFSVIALEGVEVNCRSVQTLILGPTREIVVQISQVIASLSAGMPAVRCHAFIGGMPVADDRVRVKNCHIAVGTPGRIKQLVQEGFLKTDAIRLFVLDEADKLLDDKFQKSINWIYNRLPTSKQVLATSATYPEALAQLLTKYMQTPTFVRLNVRSLALLGVKQFYRITEFHPLVHKSYENKVPLLVDILSSLPFGQCIIFSNYQLRAQALCDRLCSSGWPTALISGSQEQAERLRAIDKLKQFQCRILVSTDLTARGIDADNVDLVINLDVPWDTDTYLHRIGRAGRYGSSGIAVTLATEGEEQELLKQMQHTGKLNMLPLPDRLNKDLWTDTSLDNTDHEEVEITSGQIEPRNSETIRETVSAGLIESWQKEENLKLAAQGLRKKCGAKLTKTKPEVITNGKSLLRRECFEQPTTFNSDDSDDSFKPELSINSLWRPVEPSSINDDQSYGGDFQPEVLFERKSLPVVDDEVSDYDDDTAPIADEMPKFDEIPIVMPVLAECDNDDELLPRIKRTVLASRVDFYLAVKAELKKVWSENEECDNGHHSSVEFGRCLELLAKATLPPFHDSDNLPTAANIDDDLNEVRSSSSSPSSEILIAEKMDRAETANEGEASSPTYMNGPTLQATMKYGTWHVTYLKDKMSGNVD